MTLIRIKLSSLTLVDKSWLSKLLVRSSFLPPLNVMLLPPPSSLVPLITFYVTPSPCSTSSITSKNVATYELMGSTRLISSILSLPPNVTILPFDYGVILATCYMVLLVFIELINDVLPWGASPRG